MNERVITNADNLPPPLVTLDQLKIDFAHLEAELAALEAAEIPNVIEDQDDMTDATKVAIALNDVRRKIEAARVDASRPVLDAQTTINDYFKRDLNQRAAAKQAAIDVPAKAFLKKKAEREQAERDRIAREAREKAEIAAAEARRIADEAAAKAKTAETEALQKAHAAETPEQHGDAMGDFAKTTAEGIITTLQAQNKADALTDFANKATAAATAPLSNVSKIATDAGSAKLQPKWAFQIIDFNALDFELLRGHFTEASIEAAMRSFIKAGGRYITGATIFDDAKPRYK